MPRARKAVVFLTAVISKCVAAALHPVHLA